MMQLELIGCTGAGKSTFAVDLVEAARGRGIELVSGDQVVLDRIGCKGVTSPTLRTSLVHAAALGVCLRRGGQYIDLMSVARQSLRSAGICRRQQWNQFRKVLKQLGRYELIRMTKTQDAWALVDEGTLQSAHNLFVHVGYQLNEPQLWRFAESVPVPELAVYMRPSEETLVERTLQRGHPRITRPTLRCVTSFVRQALYAFDQVTCHERIAGRTIVIENGTVVRAPEGAAVPWARDVVDLISRVIVAQEVTARNSIPKETAHRANVMI